MLELELDNAKATLEGGGWKPGKEDQPFLYLNLSVAADADVLAFFSPDLKNFYYNENATKDLAGGLPLRDPDMVFPHKRREEMTGATLTIKHGLGEMIFTDAVLDEFELTPMINSTVVVAFRAKVFPQEGHVGKLFFLQKREVSLTVEPMEPPQLGLKDAA
jgi:hypothetical protein